MPEWLDAICELGHYEDTSRLYEARDGTRMVLPMVRRTHLPGPVATVFSMAPTWGTGGLLAADALTVDHVRAVFEDLSHSPAMRTTVRPDFAQAPLWAACRPPGAIELPVTHHVLDLDRDFDQLWANFSKMARKAIRKAQREGVTVDSDASGKLVPEFYELYEGWVERRARQRHIPLPVARYRGHHNEPLARLELLADRLGESFRVWVARLDDRPIAAMITLIRGDVALAWRAASDIEVAGPVRANDLLHREAIQFACEQGCRYYNMGESGGVESLMRFKLRFGATPRTFAGYRFERLPITPITSRVEGAKQFAVHALVHGA